VVGVACAVCVTWQLGQFSLRSLFECLEVERILQLILCMMLEKKILLYSRHTALLTIVTEVPPPNRALLFNYYSLFLFNYLYLFELKRRRKRIYFVIIIIISRV